MRKHGAAPCYSRSGTFLASILVLGTISAIRILVGSSVRRTPPKASRLLPKADASLPFPAIRPEAMQFADGGLASMDFFFTRLYGQTCIASVTASQEQAIEFRSLRLTAPELGMYRSAPSLSRSVDAFESVAVTLWCDADFDTPHPLDVRVWLHYGQLSWGPQRLRLDSHHDGEDWGTTASPGLKSSISPHPLQSLFGKLSRDGFCGPAHGGTHCLSEWGCCNSATGGGKCGDTPGQGCGEGCIPFGGGETCTCGKANVSRSGRAGAAAAAACDVAAPVSVGLFTIFKPGPESGVAWLQSWLTHGAAHIYLYVNADADALGAAGTARVLALAEAFPARVTLVMWPYSWYSGSAEPRRGGLPTLRHRASLAAYASALYRWGHRHTHLAYFDFDEYLVLPPPGLSPLLPLLYPGASEQEAFRRTPTGSAAKSRGAPVGLTPSPPRLGDAPRVAASGTGSGSPLDTLLRSFPAARWVTVRQSPAVVMNTSSSAEGVEAAIGAFTAVGRPGFLRWPGVRVDQRTKAFLRTPWGDARAAGCCAPPAFGPATRLLLPKVHGPQPRPRSGTVGSGGGAGGEEETGPTDERETVTPSSAQAYFLHLTNLGAHLSLSAARQVAWAAAATEADASFEAHVAAILQGPFSL